MVFVDTTVLVYARDLSEPDKQPLAMGWIDHLWDTGEGRLTVQVLNELYVTLTRKLAPGLSAAEARADVVDLSAWQPIDLTTEVVGMAWEIEDRFGLSYWDAMIVAAAQASGAAHLLTEDLQAGQDFDGVVVVDPFQTAPADLV